MRTRGFTVTAKYTDTVHGFPFDKHDTNYHNAFRVSVKRGKVRRSFMFYDSAHNCEMGIDTLDNDNLKCALYSFLSDGMSGQQDFEEFCNEFGYDTDSLSAHKIWQACQKTAKKLEGFNLTEYELIDHINALNC